jgi:predicted nuclease with TOPRIM domain
MNLKIPNNKAIEILQKRIGELGSFDFQPKVWKDKTQNDLKEIFSLGDTKWVQVSGINFTTYITSEKDQVMRDGKVQARQLLESYIEQIQEYSKIQEEREVIEENNYKKKYSDLLTEWNELVPSYNSLLKEKDQLFEVIDSKDVEIGNGNDEIERLRKNTVQLDNISLKRLFSLITNLPLGQIIALIVVVIGIVTGSFKLGEIYSNSKAENDKYEIRKENDTLIQKNNELEKSNKSLEIEVNDLNNRIDSLTKVKNTMPNK